MYREMFSLEGKTAIVTGGSRGIGQSIAEALAEMGATVVLASRKIEALNQVKDKITAAGGKADAIAAHLGKLDELDALVNETLERYGGIDILVNNAATNPVFGTCMDIQLEAWDKIMDVNLRGMFFLTQAVGKVMVEKQSGSVINVSSEAAYCPSPGLGVYSISKAAVNMLTKVFAQEWAPNKVRVNGIAPGLVQTKFSQALWVDEGIRQIALSGIPLGRLAQPDEMAGMAIYLASDASSYVTGQTFQVDGGREIRGI
ncbi:MAG: glucose 1-dehydrogenase [Candidatus Geothermincolia bacterium]